MGAGSVVTGDASPAVKKLEGDVPPDSRIKWPKYGVFPICNVFLG